MYYVNRKGIESRLDCIDELAGALKDLAAGWSGTIMQGLAQERALQLALEIVTDIGSFLIDGFMMRDASSYEDIVDVIAGEGVVSERSAASLVALVALRKPLVQDYDQWPRSQLHPLTGDLAELLTGFEADVRDYLRRELDPWETKNEAR